MVPEGRGVFTRMTITENLQMGAYIRNDNEPLPLTWKKCLAFSPACASAKTSWLAPCQVASSKCWPWAAR
jgi:branched-chain amino acid transport system ATP-binding protein